MRPVPEHHRRLRHVALHVVVGGSDGLPDPVQIRLAVREPLRLESRRTVRVPAPQPRQSQTRERGFESRHHVRYHRGPGRKFGSPSDCERHGLRAKLASAVPDGPPEAGFPRRRDPVRTGFGRSPAMHHALVLAALLGAAALDAERARRASRRETKCSSVAACSVTEATQKIGNGPLATLSWRQPSRTGLRKAVRTASRARCDRVSLGVLPCVIAPRTRGSCWAALRSNAAEPDDVPAGHEVVQRRCLQCHGAAQTDGRTGPFVAWRAPSPAGRGDRRWKRAGAT